jgi:hypothetical protein
MHKRAQSDMDEQRSTDTAHSRPGRLGQLTHGGTVKPQLVRELVQRGADRDLHSQQWAVSLKGFGSRAGCTHGWERGKCPSLKCL